MIEDMIKAVMSDAEFREYSGIDATPKLFWAKAHAGTIIPTKKDGDAGFDIYGRFDEDYVIIKPHETKMIPTDLHCAFPSEYVMILKERGSTGSKGMGGRCGVIDSGFRGKIFVPITNHNDYALVIVKGEYAKDNHINVGELNKHLCMSCDGVAYSPIFAYPYEKAICQGVLHEVPRLHSQEIPLEELLSIESERGEGMLGDSGK